MIILKSDGLFSDVVDRLNAKAPTDYENFHYDSRYGFRTKYGVFNSILEEKRPEVEAVIGEELNPTYSMMYHTREQTLIHPSLGPYTQDISVFVPFRVDLPPVEFGAYDGDTVSEVTLGVGDAFVFEGFKVTKWMWPLPEGPGVNLLAKFNYIRRSDPCAHLLKWDGYQDMFGKGLDETRVNRTGPDFYDRIQNQCFANHGTQYWDYRKVVNDQFDGWLAERGFPVLTGQRFSETSEHNSESDDLSLRFKDDI